MRTLSATLLQAQKDMGDLLCKIVLGGTYTYGVDTANRLLKVSHTERVYSQTAEVLIDNSDGALNGLDLKGLQGILSYGYKTSAGDEYSATAPLKVKGASYISAGGLLACQLNLQGIPDKLDLEEAKYAYTPKSTDTKVVKTLVDNIVGSKGGLFEWCETQDAIWDSYDSLTTTYKPRDYFRVYIGETRLAKIKELLGYTKCVMRVQSDGKLHIFLPTVSGTSYDYEYNDTIAAANHTFFNKAYRERLVIPNRITVKSSDNATKKYTGTATDSTNFALYPVLRCIRKRLDNNAQAKSIAEALLERVQVDSERGDGLVPMNVGQEVYDYIKITDTREGVNRTGNVGYIIREYEPGKFNMRFGFGNVLVGNLIGTQTKAPDASEQPFVTYAEFAKQLETIYGNMSNLALAVDGLISIVDELLHERIQAPET